MDNAELEALARAQPNPFAGSVLRNGFEQPPNDVPEIHAAQRQKLQALFEDVRSTAQLALQVITGEPGDGKTHLLATLRADAERSWLRPGEERAMVPIDPLRDLEAPFLHILRALVRGLSRPIGEGTATSPIEWILWRILAVQVREHPELSEVAEALGTKKYPGITRTIVQEHWERIAPVLGAAPPQRTDDDTWSVLCRFPTQPRLALRWLGGASLPEEELRPLGITAPIESEDRAFRALSTLLLLTDVPIVLGFDQLEGVARLGDEAVTRFLQALGDQLYTAGGRAAILLFCQAQAWADFSTGVQAQTRDRLTQRAILHLGAVQPSLGEQLIAHRLEPMWRGLGVTPPHPTFPYPPGYVLRTITEQQLRGPRRILAYFAERGFDADSAIAPKPLEPREVALAEYERLRAQPHPSTPDESAGMAQAALAGILEKAKAVGDTTVIAARRVRSGIEVKVARGGRESKVYVEASNSRNGMAAKAVAKRMEGALSKVDRAVLLRGEQIPVPPLASGMLEKLGSRAAVVRVDDDDMKSFVAVESLLNSAAAGDIDLPLAVATDVVVQEIAPRIAAVRKFLDAAAGVSGDPPRAAEAKSVVLDALGKPPFAASEAQLAKAHGVTPERIAGESDALEREGKAVVLSGKDGGRTVMRRPR